MIHKISSTTIFSLAIFFALPALAAPSILSVNGNVSDENQIEISGSGFKIKNPATPLSFKNYEDGQMNGNGFTAWFTDNFEVATSGNKTNSLYYGRAFYNGTVGERVWNRYIFPADYTTIFTSFWFKIDENQQSGKFYRLYFGEGTSNNIYLSTGCDNTLIRGASECNGSTNWGSGGNIPSQTWTRIEVLADTSKFIVWRDGIEVFTRYDWTNGGSCAWNTNGHALDLPNMIDEPGPARCSTNPTYEGEYSYDDIYVDNTLARVEMGNAPSFLACTKREIQIPSSWSQDLITFQVNQGSFGSGEQAYLFVVDENGDASEGYPITFGEGSGDAIPPASPSGLIVS